MNKEISDLVIKAQEEWASYVVDIGTQHSKGNDISNLMGNFLNELYAFEISEVLFKPTKASINQFRKTKAEFISYFTAENKLYKEDKGFALEPWKKIVFDTFNIIKVNNEILSMGNYYFENYESKTTKVEFTFGYIVDDVDKLRINLHHSSLPFQV